LSIVQAEISGPAYRYKQSRLKEIDKKDLSVLKIYHTFIYFKPVFIVNSLLNL
jgi:hypothetical protein